MKKSTIILISLLATTIRAFAQKNGNHISHAEITDLDPLASRPLVEIILPILFMMFLAFMLVSLIKYFLDYRLKNKLIDRGMSEQLSAYLSNKNDSEKQHDAIKWAILFSGIGMGLIITYLTAPIHLHSLAIMAFCLGLSYFAYFSYLRKKTDK
jgi:membrane protein YqaA with SNARE-associated domain